MIAYIKGRLAKVNPDGIILENQGIGYRMMMPMRMEGFPKMGLSVLATLTVYELKMAIMTEDVKTISSTPGLGPKGAKKLILELKDKMEFEGMEEDGIETEALSPQGDTQDAVMITIEGLVSLGYSRTEAALAVRKVEDAASYEPEELLKKALKNIMI